MAAPNDKLKKLISQSKTKLNRLADNHSGSKYNNKSGTYNNEKYDSVGEKDYAIQLDFRKKAGDIKDWKRQVKIDLTVNGFHITNYYIDFIIEHNSGQLELIEYKGYVTDSWRLKFALLKALQQELYPGSVITLVKHKEKYNPFRTVKKAGPQQP